MTRLLLSAAETFRMLMRCETLHDLKLIWKFDLWIETHFVFLILLLRVQDKSFYCSDSVSQVITRIIPALTCTPDGRHASVLQSCNQVTRLKSSHCYSPPCQDWVQSKSVCKGSSPGSSVETRVQVTLFSVHYGSVSSLTHFLQLCLGETNPTHAYNTHLSHS